MRKYKQQGIPEHSYYPVYGIGKEWMDYNLSDNIHTLKHISRENKFQTAGALLSNLLDQPLIIFINPNYISEVLQNQQLYKKFEAPLLGFREFLGNGLVLAEGEEWKRKRKFLSNMFKFDVIINFLDNIRVVSKKMLDRSDCEKFNTQMSLDELNGALSLSLFMGANIDDYLIDGKNPSHAIDLLVTDIYNHYLTPFAIFFGSKAVKMNLRASDRKINKNIETVKQFMINIIKDSIKREKQFLNSGQKQNHINLITLLLQEGHSLEKEEDISEFLEIAYSIYFAAKDTTSTFLAVFIYYLLSYPHYYKQVEEEILKMPEDYTFEDIQKLDFLQACIKETLRVNTSAPLIFTREALVDHQIGNYKITQGTFVNVGFISNQLNEKYFEDAQTFNPNRWFSESTNQTLKENPFSYIPFSGGMRNCIGQHLANLQFKVIMVEFMRKFERPLLPKDYRFEMVLKNTYALKHPLILSLQKRKQN